MKSCFGCLAGPRGPLLAMLLLVSMLNACAMAYGGSGNSRFTWDKSSAIEPAAAPSDTTTGDGDEANGIPNTSTDISNTGINIPNRIADIPNTGNDIPEAMGGRSDSPRALTREFAGRHFRPAELPPPLDSPAADNRPTVEAWVGDPKHCGPCREFLKWLATDEAAAAPVRFTLHDLRRESPPFWLTSTPTFQFPDQSGRERGGFFHAGWSANNPAALAGLVAAYDRSNPGHRAKLREQSGEQSRESDNSAKISAAKSAGKNSQNIGDALEAARRFAGLRGSFSFRPDSPVNQPVKDGLTIRYAAITGRYDLQADPPRLVLDPPQPEGTATVAGFLGVGYRVLSASLEKPQGSKPAAVAIQTNRMTVRVSVE